MSSENPPDNANEGCVGPNSEQAGKMNGCAGCPNQTACASGEAKAIDPAIAHIEDKMSQVKHKLLVLSGIFEVIYIYINIYVCMDLLTFRYYNLYIYIFIFCI